MPRVSVVGLGGTIAMAGAGGQVPALSAGQLLASVAGLERTGTDVQVVDFRQLPGASLAFADLTALAGAVADHLAGGADGAVVVQGTDTIEETAYLLDLLHPGPQPVVVTGAMRGPTQAGADGPANLLAAVQVAAADTFRDQGALVVLADEVHAARWVRKTHTTSPAAFASPDTGPLGRVVEGRPVALTRLRGRSTLPGIAHPIAPVAGTVPAVTPAAGAGRTPTVALVTMTLGDDGVLLEGLAGRVDGLVLAGFGAGHAPAHLVPTLTALAAAVPVVLASRTGSGSTLTGTYAFPGSESDLLARGLIPAGFLDPLKARILLHLLLTTSASPTTIRSSFTTAGYP